MKTTLKTSLFFLLSIFFSCSEDNSLEPGNVVDLENEVTFDQLLMLISIQNQDSSFVYTERIDSINIIINNEYSLFAQSNSINTSSFNLGISNNLLTGNTPIEYLTIAEQNDQSFDFHTVGDYANYLNQVSVLKPGEYICLIESFIIKGADGSDIKVFPYKYLNFQVEPDVRSVFLGDVNIRLR